MNVGTGIMYSIHTLGLGVGGCCYAPYPLQAGPRYLGRRVYHRGCNKVLLGGGVEGYRLPITYEFPS